MWTASGQNEFQNLLSSLRRTKSCKKDLWSKITAAVQNASLPGLATQQQWYLASGCTAIVNLVQLPWSTHQPLITSVLLVVHLLILRLYQLFLAIICLVANYTFNTQWRIASYHRLPLWEKFPFRFLVLSAASQYCRVDSELYAKII